MCQRDKFRERGLHSYLLASSETLQICRGQCPRGHRHDYRSRFRPTGTRNARRQLPCVILELCVVHVTILRDEGPVP
jgi:hypothetical protein